MTDIPDHINAPPVILSVESLAFGGDGVTRYPEGHDSAGKVVFIRGGLPGEEVSARITEQRKDFDRAELVETLTPSPGRVVPPCPLYGRCGGCQLQHLAYPAQVRIKTDWTRQFALRAGVPAEMVKPAITSPREYGYRFRVRLKVDPKGGMGFNRAGSNDVIPLDSCPVMSPELNSLANLLSGLFSGHPPGVPLELEAGALEGKGFVLVRPLAFGKKRTGGYLHRLRKTTEQLRDHFKATGIGIYYNRPGLKRRGADSPPGSLVLPLESLDLTLFPGVFAQAQLAQNRALVRTVVDLAGIRTGTRVLDLMAGMGNLSLPLALAGARVRAVELDPLACLNGRHNAVRAGLEVDFANLSAEEALKNLSTAAPGDHPEVVVADPPRNGIKGLTELLAKLAPERIVYISCNPPALARDLKALSREGYRVRDMTPLDLFPQTFHLETVSLLVRS